LINVVENVLDFTRTEQIFQALLAELKILFLVEKRELIKRLFSTIFQSKSCLDTDVLTFQSIIRLIRRDDWNSVR